MIYFRQSVLISKFIDHLKNKIMKGTTSKALSGFGILLIMCSSLFVMAQSLNDAEGNEYKTIKHGLQEWTASNLDVSQFRNGDAITEAKTNEEWIAAGSEGKPAWCYFNNDPENGKKFGKLYNWYAINDPRGLVAKGWHVPASPDWKTLIRNLLGIDVAGTKLKSKTGWKSKNGTDNIGFDALPGGYRNEKGEFKDLGTKCQWWNNSEPVEVKKSNTIYSIMLSDNSYEVSYIKVKKETGLSVRLIKDKIAK